MPEDTGTGENGEAESGSVFGGLAGARVSEELAAAVEAATTAEDLGSVPFTRPWMPKFIESLRLMPNVTAAATAAGIVRQTAQYARKRDPLFDAAWAAALEQSIDNLEQFAHRMSSTGLEQSETRVTTKTNAKGEVVETTTVVTTSRLLSPQMAMFMLSAHRPDKYRRAQRFEHVGDPDGKQPIVVRNLSDIDAEISALSAELNARAAASGQHGAPEPVPDEATRETA